MMYLRFAPVCLLIAAAPPLLAAPKTPAPVAAKAMVPAPAGITREKALHNAAQEFTAIDVDHDGKVTAAELESYRHARAVGIARARNTRVFESLDADHNGSLSREEFARLAPTDIKVDVTPIMKQTDRNGDGSISATEFTAMAAEGFARRDRNGDGTVTPDELQALGK